MSELVLSVSQFNRLVAEHLSALGEVTIEGELTEFKVSQGKWIYATLKDQESSVGLFGMIFRIRNYQQLEVGMKVRVEGVANLYQKTGRFSVTAYKITPAGEGALQLAYEKLKLQLDREGLFAPNRKRKIVAFPQKIGVLTAKNSDAYKDFFKVLKARMGGLQLYFYPVSVQGKQAVPSLLKGLSYLNSHFSDLDAIVITRGGGSLEDLQAFNDEQVARAIFASRFPVVSAVGHEKDISLCDLVADLRASTPSNAAELLVRTREEVAITVQVATNSLHTRLAQQFTEWRENIDEQVDFLNEAFTSYNQQIAELLERFEHQWQQTWQKYQQLPTQLQTQLKFLTHYSVTFFKRYHDRIQTAKVGMLRELTQQITTQTQRLTQIERLLNSLDYKQVLKRGYSLTTTASGKVISSVTQLNQGQELITSFADGQSTSKVLNIQKGS
jgi:exodeoxyribonuclease VII large subunit